MAAKKFGNKSVEDYYNDMFNLNPEKITFQTIQTRYISDLLKNCHINKVAGIDDLSGRSLKDAAYILTMPITQICKSIAIDCKVAKLNPLYRKALKQTLKTLGRSPFFR